jgi:hypothetical protein
MNWQSINLRLARLERRMPRSPSAEERQWRAFEERLRQAADPNLIRIAQAVLIALEENPGTTFADLVDTASADPGLTRLTHDDLAQFVVFSEGDAAYAEFLARNPQAKERAAAMMRFIGL